MKLLADENVDVRVVEALRKAGHDVASVLEKRPGSQDRQVLEMAREEHRVVLTHDLDFADVLRYPVADHEGVILLRFKDPSHKVILYHLLPALYPLAEIDLVHRLVVLQEHQIRLYPPTNQ